MLTLHTSVTCADPRVYPEQLLGLKPGEAFIFRTVAGHPQPALRDLAALDIETGGGVEDVLIIYHTGTLHIGLTAHIAHMLMCLM
jgi:carbonic anhydrase